MAAVNERDGLGDDLVRTCYLVRGWLLRLAYSYIGQNEDRGERERPRVGQEAIVPDVLFTSHVAALGISSIPKRCFRRIIRAMRSWRFTVRGTGRSCRDIRSSG